MADGTPTYWSIDAETYGTWVSLLGIAAAGKLMAACAAYFFDGTEPDSCKLTKQARALFEGERGRMERRRASAINGRRGGRRATAKAIHGNVDNPKSPAEVAKKSRRSSGKAVEKSAKNQAPAQASTSANDKSRLAPILNLNLSHNPQTPTPHTAAPLGSGVVSQAEFSAMVEAGLGYPTHGDYVMTG